LSQHTHCIALHSCLIVASHAMPSHCPDITRCLTRCLARCHCIAHRPACRMSLHCRLFLPHLSYITTKHSHITALHARAMAAPALSICPGFCTFSHACTRRYVRLLTSGAFCTQVGLRGGIDRDHKHARHGGVSWRGRGGPIRQAATSTASDFSRHASTASPTSTSRDGFGTNFLLFGIKCAIPPTYMSCNLSQPFFRGWLLTNPPPLWRCTCRWRHPTRGWSCRHCHWPATGRPGSTPHC
jgi:hypothetical protein